MSENIIHEMKCPSCGAQVYFTEEGQEYAYCSHCGTQVFKEDTHFDKRAEVEMHKMDVNKDLAVEQMAHERNENIQWIVFGSVMFVFLIIFYGFILR